MPRRTHHAALWLGLVACGGPQADSDGAFEPPPYAPPSACDDAPTWEGFAQGWTLTWCAPCHARALTGAERQGAPEGIDLETLADAVQWAARIDARSVQSDTMPPGGGPTDAERARIGTFLSCGLPGTSDEDSRCSAPEVTTANGVVDTSDAVEALCADGDIVVDGDLQVAGDIVVDCLCEVTGQLRTDGTPRLPRLGRVGSLALDAGATRLDLPALAALGSPLELDARPALAALSLPALGEIEGSLRLHDLPALQTVVFDRLVTVHGDVAITDSGVHTLQLPRLSQVDHLTVARLPLRDAPAINSVRELGGDLELHEIDAELDRGFSSLEATDGALRVSGLSTTTLAAFIRLTRIGGDLELTDAPALGNLEGLDDVTSVGGDLIVGRTGLSTADLEEWANEIDVQGTIDLESDDTPP